MGVHDTKTRALINLHIDRLWAANRGRLRLTDVRNAIRIEHPYRNWHPSDTHTACNDFLATAIKAEMKQPMSQHFKAVNNIYVPLRYRATLGVMPRGFYNRATGEWVDALMATPEDWEEGEDARLEFAKQVIEASEPFKENARLLRSSRAKNWLELLSRSKQKERT